MDVVPKWEIDVTLIEAWMETLDDKEYDHLLTALRYLESHGPTTGRPFVDTLVTGKRAKVKNLKELRPRPTPSGSHLRVLFAFDLQSNGIMLIGGDKAGDWSKWYDKNIPLAVELFAAHQDRLKTTAPKEKKR